MYQVVENPIMMTEIEIREAYDGKWVYIVKAEITRHGELLSGMPVVVADNPYEGREDGIYMQYRKPEYEQRYGCDMNHYEPFISSVFSVEFV